MPVLSLFLSSTCCLVHTYVKQGEAQGAVQQLVCSLGSALLGLCPEESASVSSADPSS